MPFVKYEQTPQTLKLKDRVPGTPYSVEELCRVKRLPPNALWQTGDILATDGAWQHRHVVESVTNMGLQPYPYGSAPTRCFHVVLSYLGEFFADNRYRLSPTLKKSQRELWVHEGNDPTGHLGNLRLVQPMGSTKPVKTSKPKKPYVPIWTKSKMQPFTVPGGIGQVPSPSPEAVLDQFRVKPISSDSLGESKSYVLPEDLDGIPCDECHGLPQEEMTKLDENASLWIGLTTKIPWIQPPEKSKKE